MKTEAITLAANYIFDTGFTDLQRLKILSDGLYQTARRVNTEEAWENYYRAFNQVVEEIVKLDLVDKPISFSNEKLLH